MRRATREERIKEILDNARETVERYVGVENVGAFLELSKDEDLGAHRLIYQVGIHECCEIIRIGLGISHGAFKLLKPKTEKERRYARLCAKFMAGAFRAAAQDLEDTADSFDGACSESSFSKGEANESNSTER